MLQGVTMNMVTAIELMQKVIDSMAQARLRPHRQHHLLQRQNAAGRARSVQRRARRLDRLHGRRGAQRGRKNVTINNLLPGSFDTARMHSGRVAAARRAQISEDEAAARSLAAIPAKRFGTTAEFGQTCAFLCSVHAGYITGQNILMDGGAFPGAF